jgi:hypothetical protein
LCKESSTFGPDVDQNQGLSEKLSYIFHILFWGAKNQLQLETYQTSSVAQPLLYRNKFSNHILLPKLYKLLKVFSANTVFQESSINCDIK